MAWNEESDNKQDKDPWGKNGNQGPPDLDEIVKKMQKGIGRPLYKEKERIEFLSSLSVIDFLYIIDFKISPSLTLSPSSIFILFNLSE